MSRITWRGKLKFDPGIGLYVRQTADDIAAEIKARGWRRGLWNRGKKKTIYNAHGRPIAEVHVHDSGNSEHEFEDHQDAVARPDPVEVTWDVAREAMPELATTKDIPSLEVALHEYQMARQLVELSPQDSHAQAQWKRAKNRMVAAKMKHRLNRRP